jgi:sec-independent protein translocase protein TatA
MPHIGAPELIVVGILALLVFGPKKLPELAKGLGQGIRDFKKALSQDDEPRQDEPKPVGPGA